ncbi:hypothetical protein PR048_023068 [Dryococelus australis]|uniref:Uncharacterized protein n=1 Tax=Dryococelus australis TaxID=614101 RepID=A0ABQ9GT17_9NEOP|nr:hypothetical protein PR048_023068 [Dryococelus australis]
MTHRLDFTLLCTVDPQMAVPWPLPQCYPTWQYGISFFFPFKTCYWLRVVQGVRQSHRVCVGHGTVYSELRVPYPRQTLGICTTCYMVELLQHVRPYGMVTLFIYVSDAWSTWGLAASFERGQVPDRPSVERVLAVWIKDPAYLLELFPASEAEKRGALSSKLPRTSSTLSSLCARLSTGVQCSRRTACIDCSRNGVSNVCSWNFNNPTVRQNSPLTDEHFSSANQEQGHPDIRSPDKNRFYFYFRRASDRSASHGRVAVYERFNCLHPQLGEPGSIPGRLTPGFSQVGIVPDDATGRRVFSGISLYTRPCFSDAASLSPHFTLIGSQDLTKSLLNSQLDSWIWRLLANAIRQRRRVSTWSLRLLCPGRRDCETTSASFGYAQLLSLILLFLIHSYNQKAVECVSGTIPTWENSGVARPGIEPGPQSYSAPPGVVFSWQLSASRAGIPPRNLVNISCMKHPRQALIQADLLTNSQCDQRTEYLPHRGQRGANPRPSDYKSATLSLSYEGRALIYQVEIMGGKFIWDWSSACFQQLQHRIGWRSTIYKLDSLCRRTSQQMFKIATMCHYIYMNTSNHGSAYAAEYPRLTAYSFTDVKKCDDTGGTVGVPSMLASRCSFIVQSADKFWRALDASSRVPALLPAVENVIKGRKRDSTRLAKDALVVSSLYRRRH